MIAAGGSDLREVHSVIRFVTFNRGNEPRLLGALQRRRGGRSPLSFLFALTLQETVVKLRNMDQPWTPHLFLPSYGAIPLRYSPEVEQKGALPNAFRVVTNLALKKWDDFPINWEGWETIENATTHLVVDRSHSPDDGLRPVSEYPLVKPVPGGERLSAQGCQSYLQNGDISMAFAY